MVPIKSSAAPNDTTPAALTPEQRKAVAHQLGEVKPATDSLIGSFAEAVANVRNHEHPSWEDLYCMDLTSYMGERMAPVLRRLLDAEVELDRIRANTSSSRAASIDPDRVERVAVTLGLAMKAGNQEPYSLAMALEVAGLLQSPESAAEQLALLAEVDRLRLRVDEVERAYTFDTAALKKRAAEVEAASPWERAVAGLNALVDAKVAFWIEPDGHISGPFGDEHIEWDHDNTRWRLVHDDEDDDSHEAKVAEYLSTPYTDDTGSAESEALAAVDRSIAAQFPLLAALREAPHDAASKGSSS